MTSVPITAPSEGLVMVVGQVTAAADAIEGTPTLQLRLRVDGTSVTSEEGAVSYFGQDVQASNALTAVVPVASGDHTIHIDGRVAAIGGPIDLSGRSLSVMFVPKGSGVSIPA